MAKGPSLVRGALLGLVTSIGGVALFSIGDRLVGLPFVPYDAFEWSARVAPGAWLTASIDLMIRAIRGLGVGPTSVAAKAAEKGLAIMLVLVAGTLAGVLVALVARRIDPARPRRVALVGAAVGVLAATIALGIEATFGHGPLARPGAALWIVAVCVAWGAILGRAIAATVVREPELPSERRQRRRFLKILATGVVGMCAAALGLSSWKRRRGGTMSPEALVPEAVPRPFAPLPGTRREITPNEDFYRVDINLRPPEIDSQSWRLRIGGLIERPRELTLADLRARPAVRQLVTLECISNPVGGDLISTSRWTGTRLVDLLDELGVHPNATAVNLRSADGFHESVPMAEARDPRTMLVYEMGGEPLTAEHGFPLRIFIPGHFGMKQPKWIEEMDLAPAPTPGYWVERGWSRTAEVQITSVIDTASPRGVGGIAFAGARGIGRVEVQIDDGDWQEARLLTPPISPLTWVLWRFDGPIPRGSLRVRVRAYDGRGVQQTAQVASPHPDGATGLHSKRFGG